MMNDNTTILLAQIIAGLASIIGVWYMNHAQNKRDEKKRQEEEEAAEKKRQAEAKQVEENGKTERAKLRAELEDNAQRFINDTFEDMRIRIASLEDELERQVTKYETKISKLTDSYEAQLASIRASMVELQHTVDKQAERISVLEDENGRLRDENHRLKSGKGSKI